ncbi:MAG: hypothetical protein JNM76_02570 [Betaproteobacteria bacterium]|nr:hypothetical protein [Betaproteobacteria bacterium]
MIPKTEYLCVYDYGMGGVWFIVNARSTLEVESKLPGIVAFEDKPEWMAPEDKAALFSSCKRKGFRWDIDEEPSGWLKKHLNSRNDARNL